MQPRLICGKSVCVCYCCFFRAGSLDRQCWHHICSQMPSCHRPSCRARSSSSNDIQSHSRTIIRERHFEPSLFLLLLTGQLNLRYQWFLNDERYSCRASIVVLDTLWCFPLSCLWRQFLDFGMEALVSVHLCFSLGNPVPPYDFPSCTMRAFSIIIFLTRIVSSSFWWSAVKRYPSGVASDTP